MGHSIIVVDNQAEIFNDADLEVLLALLAEEAGAHIEKYPELGTLVREWWEALAHCGPGTIDLPMEMVVASPAKMKELEALLAAVEARTVAFGTGIPSALLNAWNRVPGVIFYGDFPVARMIEAIGRLRAFLAKVAKG